MATETRIKRVTKEDLGKTLDTLGENVKGHHFARMNSDNADYTVEYEYTLPTNTFTEPEDGDDLLGKELTDLQDDVTISNGTVTATLVYNESYPGFSSTAEGYFFATKTTTSADKVYLQYIVKGKVTNESLVYDSDNTTPYDGVHIRWIAKDKDTAPVVEKLVVRYIDGEEEIRKEYKVNFTLADPEGE